MYHPTPLIGSRPQGPSGRRCGMVHSSRSERLPETLVNSWQHTPVVFRGTPGPVRSTSKQFSPQPGSCRPIVISSQGGSRHLESLLLSPYHSGLYAMSASAPLPRVRSLDIIRRTSQECGTRNAQRILLPKRGLFSVSSPGCKLKWFREPVALEST